MIATKNTLPAHIEEYFADKRARNAEAMRRLFKAEAGRTEDACIEAAFLVLAAGPEDMLDRVFRSVKT